MSHPDPIPTPASAEPPPTNMPPMPEGIHPTIVPPFVGSVVRQKRWAGQIVDDITHDLTPTIPPKPDSEDTLDNILWGVETAGVFVSPFADLIEAAGGPAAVGLAAQTATIFWPLPPPIKAGVGPSVTALAQLVVLADAGIKVAPSLFGGVRHLLDQWSVPDSEERSDPLTPRTPWVWLEEERKELAYIDKTMVRFRERPAYQPGDWQQEFLDDSGFGGGGIVASQLPGDLRDLVSASGRVTAHTWLLGDTIEHDLSPALSGATDSIRPADIAFGEMDMGYDDLRWVSDATLEGLTVNAAAMSAGLTPWVAGISKEIEQRRHELEAFRPQLAPAARSDSPPGSGSSGGGLSWDESLELYQRKTGETAQNIAWIRKHPDDKAESGENVDWTFRDIVRDAVRRSGEVPLFAMGGVVPGMVGTPVPAVVHGGEEIVGAGNGGGVPINLEVHVPGTVISEGDLARNVRDGLMRRFD